MCKDGLDALHAKSLQGMRQRAFQRHCLMHHAVKRGPASCVLSGAQASWSHLLNSSGQNCIPVTETGQLIGLMPLHLALCYRSCLQD